jgi:predicted RNase H-like HicB family nuclease
MVEREFRVFIHDEDDAYWAEVEELPGCFASGQTLDELREAVVEAITLYLVGGEAGISTPPASTRGRIDEMRVLVPSPA